VLSASQIEPLPRREAVDVDPALRGRGRGDGSRGRHPPQRRHRREARAFSFLGWVSRLEPVTPGNLAAETGLPATTIRDYVRRLVQRGIARRVANPSDGSSYLLVLTPKGRRIATQGWPAVVEAYGRIARHLERPAAEHLATARELREAVKLALAETEREPRPPRLRSMP
jgi:DNA-binding MarR family transcriptional regulator